APTPEAAAPPAASPPTPAGAVPAPKPPSASPTPDPAKSGETKTHLLANEQAEAARSAALSGKIPDAPRDKTLFQGKGADAGTIEVGLPPANSVVIRLDGIKAHEADETCKTKDAAWPCGAKARAALASFIRYRAGTCAVPPGGQIKDFTTRCSVVGQGWAMPEAGAGAFP